MNTVDDARIELFDPLADRPERALETLSPLGDWLTIDRLPSATGVDDDLAAVATLATDTIGRFVRAPENAEALAHVIDGLYRGERDPDVQAAFDGMLADIAETGLNLRFEVAGVGDPAVALDGQAVLPEGVEAAILENGDGRTVVLLSDDLGFRDMILVAQEAAIDVLIARAEATGLDMDGTSVQDDLAALIRYGELPDINRMGDNGDTAADRPVISVFYDGEIRDATMV